MKEMETYSNPPIQNLDGYFETLDQMAPVALEDNLRVQRLQALRQRAASTVIAESVEVQRHALSQKALDTIGHAAVGLPYTIEGTVQEIFGANPVPSPMPVYRSEVALGA